MSPAKNERCQFVSVEGGAKCRHCGALVSVQTAPERIIAYCSGGRNRRRRGGPGTELSKSLKRLGFRPKEGCACTEHAADMDRRGVQWCRENVDTIMGWLEDEATRRGFRWLFRMSPVRTLVHNAIAAAEQKASTD